MDVAITGSSGLIGTALANELHERGDRVVPVVRGTGLGLRWDPATGVIDASGFAGFDAVVHLAGEGIGEKKWTDEQKRKIRDSRVQGTALLAGALAGLEQPPSVLVSGSAVGWYGNRGDEALTETSDPGPIDDFLVDVCLEWEAATAAAEAAGIRTVHLRSGIVLSPDGGALARMLTPFKLGLGGRVASGRQFMSWISLADEVGAILHAIDTASLSGPVNATAPAPVTNLEFTHALGRALHRPTKLPTPLLPLKVVYGTELVQHLLVEGARVMPAALDNSGYTFAHPTLDVALAALLA
ncbi:MAG: TIGR01777 family oxidoreductase [Acidimicrobiia bacterium]